MSNPHDKYTLHHGDCLEVMADIPDGSVDMILTDLPYGTTQCKWDSIIPFEPLWAHYKRVIKKNGAIVLTASQPFTSALVMSNPAWFKYEWVWRKTRITGHLNVKRRPMLAHENILLFCDGSPTYNPIMTKSAMRKTGALEKHGSETDCYGEFKSELIYRDEYYPTSVIDCPQDSDVTVTKAHRPDKIPRHPTQKPVKLMEYLIRTYTNPGETVLDSCMGSGTTGVACWKAGRRFIGIEKDAEYFKTAQYRLCVAFQQINLFDEDEE